MIFYLLCFVLFILVYKIFEKRGKLLYAFIAALLPALLEGLRYKFLGEDMLGYGSMYFYDLKGTTNIFKALSLDESKEIGFKLIIYISQQLSDSINFYMFLCAYLKIGIIYYLAFVNRKRLNSTVFLLTYFVFMYCYGFSLMRQSIALAISMLAVYFWVEKNYKFYIVAVAIGYTFHNSALIMLFLPLIRYIPNMKVAISIGVGGSLFLYFAITTIMSYLLTTNIFNEGKVEMYIDTGVKMACADFVVSIFFCLYSLFIIRTKKLLSEELTMACILCSFFSLTFLLLSNYIEVAFRMAFYFEFALLLLTPIAIKNSKQKLHELAYVILFIAYFIVVARHGLGGTIPYKSEILGI